MACCCGCKVLFVHGSIVFAWVFSHGMFLSDSTNNICVKVTVLVIQNIITKLSLRSVSPLFNVSTEDSTGVNCDHMWRRRSKVHSAVTFLFQNASSYIKMEQIMPCSKWSQSMFQTVHCSRFCMTCMKWLVWTGCLFWFGASWGLNVTTKANCSIIILHKSLSWREHPLNKSQTNVHVDRIAEEFIDNDLDKQLFFVHALCQLLS